MQSIEYQILKIFKGKSKGKLMFPAEFARFGSPEAVRKALQRLEDKGAIVRAAQGVYALPKISDFVGPVLPTAEEVAEAIIKRDKIRTIPTGSFALNALGLSTQLPMKIVMLTDGSPREIKVGDRTIKFKKTTPKNLLAKGKISRLAIQALKEIGNGKLSPAEEQNFIKILKNEAPKDLLHDSKLAPVWIQKIMKKAM